MFKKGEPRHPDAGRKKGSRNKVVILRAAVIMALEGFSPAKELIKVYNGAKSNQEKFEILKYLHSFMEAPQAAAQPLTHDSPEGSVANAKEVARELAELSKSIEPPTNPGQA